MELFISSYAVLIGKRQFYNYLIYYTIKCTLLSNFFFKKFPKSYFLPNFDEFFEHFFVIFPKSVDIFYILWYTSNISSILCK